jgi:hypothetical protein
MSPYRTPAETPVYEVINPHPILPWRSKHHTCVVCGQDSSSFFTYKAAGGTAGVAPCSANLGYRWYGARIPCLDTRPHFHATCNLCSVSYLMAPPAP